MRLFLIYSLCVRLLRLLLIIRISFLVLPLEVTFFVPMTLQLLNVQELYLELAGA